MVRLAGAIRGPQQERIGHPAPGSPAKGQPPGSAAQGRPCRPGRMYQEAVQKLLPSPVPGEGQEVRTRGVQGAESLWWN